MSLALLERGAAALGDLAGEVVFVGGATVVLWITDPGAPPPRPTIDVDVIVEVATRGEYYAFEDRLRAAEFEEEGTVICRWIHRSTRLVVDAMPTEAAILGFENRWQREAFPHAVDRELPSGVRIKAVPPAYLLATKIEAYLGRGEGDLRGSRDFADIVALLDGREELVGEVAEAPNTLRGYIAEAAATLLDDSRIVDGIHSQLLPDAASQVRAEEVVLPRLREIAGMAA